MVISRHRWNCVERSASIESGLALITALMALGFLTILGGALLTMIQIDTRISHNYVTRTQAHYLAEAGIEVARETLRSSARGLSANLTAAAGADGMLSTSRNLAALLASDDAPLLPEAGALRTDGLSMIDSTGNAIGTYHVFIRNDSADGETATVDGNGVVALLSVGRVGNASRTIGALVKRGSFPTIPAALTLNGGVGLFDAPDSILFQFDGNDHGGSGDNRNAIGVISDGDDRGVRNAIPLNRVANYTGDGGLTPDVADIGGDLSGTLTTVSGLESMVDAISNLATDTYTPGFGNKAAIGDIGSASDRRVVLVNGDVDFGPGDGYGILLVRGVATFVGNFSWNGLVLAIGQGEIHWNGGSNGSIRGGMFIAKTRDSATALAPMGPTRATRGDVRADFNGGGGTGILYDTAAIADAEGSFPYVPIAITEY